MGLFTLEHSKAAYLADFAVYGAAVLLLALALTVEPYGQRLETAALVVAGLAAWSLIEYLMHRFVLHGWQPFQRWHAEHHDRPTALIQAPTLVSAGLIVTLVFVPTWLLSHWWPACALSLGVVAGYFGYAVTHHATHHWRADSAWLKRRKRWHALHHHNVDRPSCFGVTSGVWDHVFGSAAAPRRRAADKAPSYMPSSGV